MRERIRTADATDAALRIMNLNGEIKRACRIMADLVTDYAYPYDDGTYGNGGMSSCDRAFSFLKKNGFAEETERNVWRIDWEKLGGV